MADELIVIGSGGAGLTAALHAATRGAKVTVLESAPVFGGTTALSGGVQWAPLNRLGREAFGLEDSPEEVLQYISAQTLGLVDEETIEAFIRNAPLEVEFLIANTPCEVSAAEIPDYYFGRPGAKGPGRAVTVGLYEAARLGEYQELLREPPLLGTVGPVTTQEESMGGWAGYTSRSLFDLYEERRAQGIVARGRALVGGLIEACLEHNVTLINNARARSLVMQGTRVAGLEAVVNGDVRKFSSPLGVVVAAGGFEWNRRLWDSFVGVPLDGAASPPYNVGDGLGMMSKAGARFGNLNQVWWSPGLLIPGETYDDQARVRAGAGGGLRTRPGSITVNRFGRRFFNENLPYNDAGRMLAYFDPHTYTFVNYPAYCIADHETVEREPVLWRDSVTPRTPDWFTEAPTLRELALKIGVDAAGLEEEVENWNAICADGVDPVFHRGEREYDLTRSAWNQRRSEVGDGIKNGILRPIKEGPYYAHQLRSVCYGTKGGAVIDGGARVLDYDNAPIPGLFAAGNTTAGIFGHGYPGPGATIGAAMVMGWTAGLSATS